VAAPAVAFLGPVFPGAQLAGALVLTRGQAPFWVAPMALLLGVLRVVAPGSPLAGFEEVVSQALEPLGTLAAAGVLTAAAARREVPWSLWLLPGALVLTALVDGLSAWGTQSGYPLAAPLALAWLAAAALCIPLQFQAVARRREVRWQRRTEAELRDAQELYHALAESSFDLVAELDGRECFTYVSRRYEELLGYAREELLGLRPIDLVHRDDAPAAARFAQQAAETGFASGLEVRARRRDGSHLWLESVARAFVTRDGERRWVMNSRDISDRKLAEDLRERVREHLEEAVSERTIALRASEARFRALADHAPELISEFDGRGRYTFANAGFRDLLGRDPADLVGTNPERLIHPDDLPASRASMVHALVHESNARAVHRLRHADGSWRWFENTGRAYHTASGELRFVSIGRDVTEARRAEAERRQLQAHVQQMQRLESLGVLAGGIAHDFNNLLAVILGNVELLESASGCPPEVGERLQRIGAAARYAEALTDQMLAYAGKSLSGLAPLDLSRLVHETLELLQASLAGKCRLVLQLSDDPPRVLGDATQLRQILVNLVTNAREALGDDGGDVRLRTGLCRPEAAALADALGATDRSAKVWAFLEVADDGPGMDDALRRRVFEPFYTTKRSGRGLGLAAVLGIATAHGGILQLDTGPGRGCVFRLLLPHHDAAEAEARAARPVGADGHAEERRAPAGRVLVVDDDDAVREVGQRLLERAGLQVETCAGGVEALARLRGGPPLDAVLLDLAMPDITGAEVLRALGRERPELPVLIASGYSRELAADRLEGAAPFAFIEKPYDPDALLAAIRSALHARRPA
jgi:PAS domain S-box-containing protein